MKKTRIAPLLSACLLAGCGAPAPGTPTDTPTAEEEAADFDGTLRMENGMAQPMLNYSYARAEDYSNENSVYIVCLDRPLQPGKEL